MLLDAEKKEQPHSQSNTPHDPWSDLFEPLIESDRHQCQAWKDEISNLLIFAGLFSGVITGFITQSYQVMQLNPNDTMIYILAHIAERLDNPSSTPFPLFPSQGDITFSSNLPRVQPSPTSPVIVRNTLWFVSLVLSISTAIIGVICLQWIREHERYPASLSPRERFAIYTMRIEGLRAWYIPQILSTLPLLLQLSLILFLIGLIVFVIGFGVAVAVPVIIAISLPLIFLMSTTTLPALQSIGLCLPISSHTGRLNVPSQCPYKSPQARAMCRLLAASSYIFTFISCVSLGIYWVISRTNPYRLLRTTMHGGMPSRQEHFSKVDRQETRHVILSAWKKDAWPDFDKEWLHIRDAYARNLYSQNLWINSDTSVHYSRLTGPLYDLLTGVRALCLKGPETQTQTTAYDCVHSLVADLAEMKQKPGLGNIHFYAQSLLGSGSPDNGFQSYSRIIANPTSNLLQDETMFIFTSSACYSPSNVITERFTILLAKMLHHLRPPHLAEPTIDNLLPGVALEQSRPSYPSHQLTRLYTLLARSRNVDFSRDENIELINVLRQYEELTPNDVSETNDTLITSEKLWDLLYKTVKATGKEDEAFRGDDEFPEGIPNRSLLRRATTLFSA